MARYTFRIHQVDSVQDNSDGWVNSDEMTSANIANIPDEMETVPASGKIGTSIPTPLARIYLFKTAYKVLNAAFDSNEDTKRNSSYAQLVSDSLDILQLLFEKGNDPDFRFIKWNKDAETQKLERLESDGPTLLSDSLKMAFDTARSFDNEMTLIEYKGLLLGGLSPFTLVYTSPNLRRELEEKRRSGNFDFSSNKKVEFCGVTPTPLNERPKEFQEFLLSLTMVYKSALFKAESSFWDFGTYITNQLGSDFTAETCRKIEAETKDKIKAERAEKKKDGEVEKEVTFDDCVKKFFEESYKEFNTSLTVAGIDLRWNNRMPSLDNSNFVMAPTSTEYKKYMEVAPLVLPERFTQRGWNYTDREDKWDTNTRILSSMCRDLGNKMYKGQQIGSRYLPKNGGFNGEYSTIRYPWVSNSDFFYDNIVDLGYAINTEKYFNNATSNARGGAVSFLLPIRREYFLFFTIDDLKDNLKMTARYESPDDMATLQEVKVELTIRLKGDNQITFSKTYDSSEIYREASMGIGVFPFYQLHKDSGLMNEYSIYMFEETQKSSLHFFADDNLENALAVNGVPRSTLAVGTSTIYSLRNKTSNKFDFIEVKVDDKREVSYSALIIPLWKKYEEDHNKSQASVTMVALDFGTSNTHIAYYNPNGRSIESFSIGAEDMQMVLLNMPMQDDRSGKMDYRNKKSFGDVGAMADFLREFVPSVIGKENIQGIAYPVKTASLNSALLYEANPKLFEAVNIGYDVNNETIQLDSRYFEYATDLKWAAQKTRGAIFQRKTNNDNNLSVAKSRISAYCEQTLWMLKNMIVNKGYCAQGIGMVYFYPASMEEDDRTMFKNAWKNAVQTIFTNCGFSVDLKDPELESVAPYYSLLKNGNNSQRLYSYNSVNIDIGGGTTDVFILDTEYRNPETQRSEKHGYEASVQFAGDNIWGTSEISGNLRNGFVKYMEDQIANRSVNVPSDLLEKYNNFKSRTGIEDKDKAAFFFKYADEFSFAEIIGNDCHLKKVLLLHYASIIYYTADIIKYIKSFCPEFKVPSTLTFTGKGSEYIKIITSDVEKIADLTYVLFNAFGIPESEFTHGGFIVEYPDNPKILTAEGGIHKYKNTDIKYTFVEKQVTSRPRGSSVENSRNLAYFDKVGESVLGFKAEEGVTYLSNRVLNYKDAVMTHFDEFIDAIYNNGDKINQVLSDIEFDEQDVKFIKEKAYESYDALGKSFEERHRDTERPILKSNLFFLAIANMLVEYSNKN